MKAPFWGKCGVVVGVSAIGIAMVLYTTGRLRAADPAGTTTGPAITPLGRASGGPVDFDYNGAAAAAANLQNAGGATPALSAPGANGGASVNGLRQAQDAPPTLPASSGPFVLRPIDPSTLPLTGDPISGAPTNGTAPAHQNPTVATSNNKPAQANTASPEPRVTSWRPVQTAFKQYVEPRTDSSVQVPSTGSYTNRPYANSPSMEQRLYGAGLQPGQAGVSNGQNSATAQSDSPNTVQAPTVPIEPPVPGEVLDGPYHAVRPGNAGSQCANCVRGNGCGPLPPGAADCPNCGGWKPGSCQPCDPNGSCILQRLACLLSKPYPDYSNGCVDFCHSWIWHEDDFWITSNHKCVPPGCGPYPYGGCPNDGMGKGINCGCGNCGFCVPPPDLYFQLDGLALTRDNQALASETVASKAGASISVGDFDFDWRVGPSITAGWRPTPKDAWEVTYFGLQDWVETQTLTDGGISLPNDPGQIGTLPGFNNIDTLNVTYQSEIQNGEVNYLWKPTNSADFMWLFGLRYFHLDEDFDMVGTTTGMDHAAIYDVHTVNDLVGLQTGVRLAHRWGERFCTDGFIKGGIYRNSVEQRQFLHDTADSDADRNFGEHQDHWAYVADAGCNVNYFICHNWCVNAGYNVIWADQLALAPNQLDFTNNPGVSGTGLYYKSGLFMHGAHVGVSCRW